MSASLFDIYNDSDPTDREFKFYVYATDQNQFYLDTVYRSNDRKRVVNTIKKWGSGESKKKWAKKHLGENNVIELTVTNGECNWHGCIDLEIDVNTHEVFIVEKPSKKRKPWNGKLVFHRK